MKGGMDIKSIVRFIDGVSLLLKWKVMKYIIDIDWIFINIYILYLCMD